MITQRLVNAARNVGIEATRNDTVTWVKSQRAAQGSRGGFCDQFDVEYDEALAAEEAQAPVKAKRNKARNANRRARDEAMRDLGLVKVRGARGGTFWE